MKDSSYLDKFATSLTKHEDWSLERAMTVVKDFKVDKKSLDEATQTALLTRLALANQMRKTKKTKSHDVVTAAGGVDTGKCKALVARMQMWITLNLAHQNALTAVGYDKYGVQDRLLFEAAAVQAEALALAKKENAKDEVDEARLAALMRIAQVYSSGTRAFAELMFHCKQLQDKTVGWADILRAVVDRLGESRPELIETSSGGPPAAFTEVAALGLARESDALVARHLAAKNLSTAKARKAAEKPTRKPSPKRQRSRERQRSRSNGSSRGRRSSRDRGRSRSRS